LSPDKSFLCVSESNRISIFKSYCLHEGADLKFAAIKNNKLICPWHNRKVPPVAQFDWNHPQKVELKDEQVCLIFEDEKILFKNLAQIPH
ncbi:MAG: Rieske 2Fe-2S domain-containing protein, partial [Nitrospinales bacterium]